MSKIVNLDPNKIVLVTDPTHPRYDPRATRNVNFDRVHDMALHGFTSLILVHKTKEGYEAVTGRGRTLDARALWALQAEEGVPESDRIHVRALVVPAADDLTLLSLAQTENYLRDPGDDPYTEAVKIQRIIDVNNARPEAERVDLATIAGWHGMSVDSLRNRLKILKAAPEVGQALKAGKVTLSDALRVSQIKDPEKQVAALANLPPVPVQTKADGKKKRRKGARGTNRRPTARRIALVIEHLGEGHKLTPALKYVLGLNPKFEKEIGL